MFSFTKSKKTCDLSRYIRRICDATTPNVTMSPDLERSEHRYNRTIPTLLCRWVDERPDDASCMFGLTSDLADRGIGVVLPEAFQADDVLLGIWTGEMEEPWFFIGSVRRLSPLGGGFWTIGVELDEFANHGRAGMVADLLPMAKQLLPGHLQHDRG